MGGEGGNGSEGDVVGSRGPRMASSIMYKETTNFVLCMKLFSSPRQLEETLQGKCRTRGMTVGWHQ